MKRFNVRKLLERLDNTLGIGYSPTTGETQLKSTSISSSATSRCRFPATSLQTLTYLSLSPFGGRGCTGSRPRAAELESPPERIELARRAETLAVVGPRLASRAFCPANRPIIRGRFPRAPCTVRRVREREREASGYGTAAARASLGALTAPRDAPD